MVSSKSFLLAAAGALALPFSSTDTHGGSESSLLTSRAGTPSSVGEHGGFYYNFWTDGGGTVNYENKDDGSYHVKWQNCSNFVGGKGWYVSTST
jgi:endo-1,4-beta-xylanase